MRKIIFIGMIIGIFISDAKKMTVIWNSLKQKFNWMPQEPNNTYR